MMQSPTVSGKDAALLVVVAAIWGFNFIPIRVALDDIQPFALAALRFLLASLPLVFFVKRPKVPLRFIVAYGFCIGLVQFGFLFLAIHNGLAAGLASLLMQMQMFFTVGLAAVFTHDRIHKRHAIGAWIAATGVVLLVVEQFARGASTTLLGLGLILVASFGWGAGNVIAKAARQRHTFDLFALTVWSSLVSPIPLAAMSFALDSHPIASIRHAGIAAWASLAFMAWVATLFGYGTWNRLLHRYSAGQVSPFTMLIPVVGLAAGYLALNESLTWVEFAAASVILAGVGYAMRTPRGQQKRAPTSAEASRNGDWSQRHV